MGMEKSLEKIGANGMSIRGSIEQLHSLGAFGRLLEIIWGVIGGHWRAIGGLLEDHWGTLRNPLGDHWGNIRDNLTNVGSGRTK